MKKQPQNEALQIAPELRSIHKLLLNLENEIRNFHQGGPELNRLQIELLKIDSMRSNGCFGWKEGHQPPKGQGILHTLLSSCYKQLEAKRQFMGRIDEEIAPQLKPIRDQLCAVLHDLPKAVGNEIALSKLQGRLLEIENTHRESGVFGSFADPLPGQGVLHDLLNEAHTRVKHEVNILEKKEKQHQHPVALEIQPIEKKLQHILESIETVHDEEELRKVRGRLCQIDNERVNGQFGVKEGQGKSPPSGQAILHDLLNSCFVQLREKEAVMAAAEKHLDIQLKPIYSQLTHLLRDLHDVKSHPKDLPRLQGLLSEIDGRRHGGVFVPQSFGDKGSSSPPSEILPGQGVLHDLLHQCYVVARSVQENEHL
eukprot:GHVP01065796.1.p2 GENE.GHVP01065796.1~~GHVP01065796.1.p2  ORF type:complete len:369 (-),score=84.71 GHVP01065796.1:855-1961(-)